MSSETTYSIEHPDYWEQDAVLVVNNERYYFQFDIGTEPTLEQALKFLFLNGKINIKNNASVV